MLSMPSLISDARKVKEPESKIQEGIVQGVLNYSGLPKINNILPGVGSSMRRGGPTRVIQVPKEERSSTKMVSGTASYGGSQAKKH